jgi:DNA-binding NarL/FixJ family response regulator
MQPMATEQTLAAMTVQRLIVVIDERALIRDCLAKCLIADNNRNFVLAYASVEVWLADVAHHPPAAVIVLYTSGQQDSEAAEIEEQVSALAKAGTSTPVVVISDANGTDHICDALKNGVRGYIPTSVPLNVAIEAMHLVQAGGVYVPADSLMSLDHSGGAPSSFKKPSHGFLTGRQAEVVRAIRCGMTNKRIAFELKMSESTVKAHIRSIMKKLNVRNRTEVALYASKGIRRQATHLAIAMLPFCCYELALPSWSLMM